MIPERKGKWGGGALAPPTPGQVTLLALKQHDNTKTFPNHTEAFSSVCSCSAPWMLLAGRTHLGCTACHVTEASASATRLLLPVTPRLLLVAMAILHSRRR